NSRIKKRQERQPGKIQGLCEEILSEDESEQPNKRSGSFKKNRGNFVKENEGEALAWCGGKGSSKNSASTTFTGTVKFPRRLVGVCNWSFSGEEPIQVSPEELLSRFGTTRSKTGYRSGWFNTFAEKAEVFRSQKNRSIRRSGLENIQSVERGSHVLSGRSCERYTLDNREFALFYDLEVDIHHSYYSEGVVVHNCHNLSQKGFEPLLLLTENARPW